MEVMLVFYAVIFVFGIYMAVSAFQMKKSGNLNPMLLAEEERKQCTDEAGLIAFLYWREAILGAAAALTGLLGVINELTDVFGKFIVLELIVFLAVFFWFANGLKLAREKFVHVESEKC